MSHEGAGERASVKRLEHGRLDLQEAAEGEKRRLSMTSARPEAPRKAKCVLSLLPCFEALIARQDVGDRRWVVEAERERLDAALAQPLQLLPPLRQNAILVGALRRRPLVRRLHAAEGYRRARPGSRPQSARIFVIFMLPAGTRGT